MLTAREAMTRGGEVGEDGVADVGEGECRVAAGG